MPERPTLGARTERGWEVDLPQRGVGRFFGAAFLLVWLCGWAAGEAFAIFFLVWGAGAVAAGDTSRLPDLPLAGAVAMIAFVAVWLALWTVGGVAAIHELLRLLWGGTRIIVAADRVIVEQRAGPFLSRREAPREAVQTVRLHGGRGTLTLETATGRLDVMRGGRREDRESLAAELQRELGLADPDRARPLVLPVGWKECVTPEGAVAVVPDPHVRAKQARVLGFLALLPASIVFLVARHGFADPGIVSLTIVCTVLALAFLAGAVWLARGRNEWRVEGGRLVLQRRFGDQVRERFVATALQLVTTTDSDGDEWFTLNAVADPGPAAAAAQAATGAAPAGLQVMGKPAGRKIVSAMNDASVPRGLAGWLAARSGVPLDDRSTPEGRAVDVAELRAMLAGSGKLGAFVDRLVGPSLEKRVPGSAADRPPSGSEPLR